MINFCQTWLRLILLLIIAPISCFICILFFPILPIRYWAYVVKSWAKIILLCNNITLEIVGEKPDYLERNCMVVANHFAWLDVITLYAICFINFIGKTEMQKWPVLNMLIRAGGTVFINRDKKKDLLKINQIIEKELISGKCIGLFPEGKVNDGKSILPFKSSLFAAPILAESKIIPITLLYYHKDGSFAYTASYARRNLWQNVIGILKLNGLSAKAVLLPFINAKDFTTREELSNYVQKQIAEVYQKR